MKRFWLFAGYDHYPNGGMSDFQKSFDSITDLIMYYEEEKTRVSWEWGQYLDSSSSLWEYL